jgi:hypothetical protein
MLLSSYTLMISSLALGSLLGILYGLSFFTSKKKALSYSSKPTSFVVHSSTRLIIISLIFYYLLLQPGLNYILILISFFVTLWITILTKSDTRQWKA